MKNRLACLSPFTLIFLPQLAKFLSEHFAKPQFYSDKLFDDITNQF